MYAAMIVIPNNVSYPRVKEASKNSLSKLQLLARVSIKKAVAIILGLEPLHLELERHFKEALIRLKKATEKNEKEAKPKHRDGLYKE